MVYVASADRNAEGERKREEDRREASVRVEARVSEWVKVVRSKAISEHEEVRLVEFLDPYEVENLYCFLYTHDLTGVTEFICPGASQAQMSMLMGK